MSGPASVGGRRGFLTLLLLSGCGFAPALGTGSAARELMGAVRAEAPSSAEDYDFVARIEERLGRADPAGFALKYDIDTSREGVGITEKGATTRYVLTGSATWTLNATTGGDRLAGGIVRNFVGWSATGSTVAGLAAEDDARRRLMRLLADQVVSAMMAQMASGTGG